MPSHPSDRSPSGVSIALGLLLLALPSVAAPSAAGEADVAFAHAVDAALCLLEDGGWSTSGSCGDLVAADGPGELRSLGGKCLDVLGSGDADGTPVVYFRCTGNANQRWRLESGLSGVRIRGLGDRCLLVGPEGESGFREAIVGSCSGAAAIWSRQGAFPDSFRLSKAGQCLDVLGSSTDDLTPIILFPCTGNPNQDWTFVADVTAPCVPGDTVLCLDRSPGDRRFEVTLHFETVLGGGFAGAGEVTPLGPVGLPKGGVISFTDSQNPEMLVKVLDGCGINGRVWVFYAATTTVGFELSVRDTVTGLVKTYSNPDTQTAIPRTDTDAFDACQLP